MVVVRLSARQPRAGLLSLIVVVLLTNDREHRAFGDPVADIHVTHAAIGAANLAEALYVTAGLERQIHLCVGNYVGGITGFASGRNGLHFSDANRRQRFLFRLGLAATDLNERGYSDYY